MIKQITHYCIQTCEERCPCMLLFLTKPDTTLWGSERGCLSVRSELRLACQLLPWPRSWEKGTDALRTVHKGMRHVAKRYHMGSAFRKQLFCIQSCNFYNIQLYASVCLNCTKKNWRIVKLLISSTKP